MAVTASWYNLGMQNFMLGLIDWEDDTIRCALTTSSYSPDKDTDEFFDDISNEVVGAGYTADGAALTTLAVNVDTAADEVQLDSDNVQWTAATITARRAVIYKDTGTPATSPLIGWVDFGEDETVTAGTFSITVDADGWFKITQA